MLGKRGLLSASLRVLVRLASVIFGLLDASSRARKVLPLFFPARARRQIARHINLART